MTKSYKICLTLRLIKLLLTLSQPHLTRQVRKKIGNVNRVFFFCICLQASMSKMIAYPNQIPLKTNCKDKIYNNSLIKERLSNSFTCQFLVNYYIVMYISRYLYLEIYIYIYLQQYCSLIWICNLVCMLCTIFMISTLQIYNIH